MESALMESPDAYGSFLTGHLLEGFADAPIQLPLQVMAALVPGQAQQTLPLEFLSELVLNLRP